MTRLACTAFGLVAAFGAAVAGQAPRDATGVAAAPPPTGNASIAGIVTSVDANPLPVRRAIVVLKESDPSADRSVVTNDDGRFEFDRLPAGRYTVTASKPAYIATPYGAKRPGGMGTPVSLANGQRLRDLTIPLARGGTISGVIRGADGRPASGVRMTVFRPSQPTALNGGFPADPITTDDRGEYRAFGLPPGEYVVAGVAPAPGVGAVALRRAEEVDALLKELQQRSPIGQPQSPLGRSSSPAPAPAPASSVDQNKVFNLAPVYYPGTPSPADAVHLTVAAGTERSGVDFTVGLVPVVTIEGRVTGFNPNENVTLLISNGTEATFGVSSTAPQLTVRPNADGGRGRFVYTNVTPGRYTISARVTGLPAPTGSSVGVGGGGGGSIGPTPANVSDIQWAVADVVVVDADIPGVSLALQPSMAFAGRVVFDGAPNQRPTDLTTVRVQVDPAPGTRLAMPINASVSGTAIGMPMRSGYTMLDADGAFVVRGLLPGPYRLAVTVPNWRVRAAVANGRDLLDAGLLIQEGATVSDAILTFTDRHNELGGRLQTPSGAAAPDYTVIAFPADRALWTSARRVVSTRPGSDGRFAFSDLPAGDYLLAALTDVDPGEWNSAAFLEQVVPATVRVTLGDTEMKRQDLQLAR